MQRKAFLLSIMACFTTMGCNNAIDEYSHRPCYVVVRNDLFNDATIASAMNPLSPGTFCLIRKTESAGVSYFDFSTNMGLSSRQKFTAVEQRMSLIFGLNNGVIVGYGNASQPATFYAYDKECPNCFDPDAIPVKSKPLTMDDKGHATCQVCHRVYDMNNRGFIIDGTTENSLPLTRFPATASGPFGVLVVQ